MLTITAAIGVTLAGTSARAAEWCARYDAYTENCGFHTFQQCLDTIRGAGGTCERNPRLFYRQRSRTTPYG